LRELEEPLFTEDVTPPKYKGEDNTMVLHKIAVLLHETSTKRGLSHTERNAYLLAQSALTPTVRRETLLGYLGRGGMKSFLTQKFYDKKAREEVLQEKRRLSKEADNRRVPDL